MRIYSVLLLTGTVLSIYGEPADSDGEALSLPTEDASANPGEETLETVYELEDFSVVAERFGEVGDFSLLSVQVLEEKELQRQVQATLGETLAWEPGLNASYFGPGASRPVIRGLGDYRVRMLVDDIGTLDVSENSPDHGVPLEPLLIRRVDVHRGPDALIFGNAAIGGAINSQTCYLPESLPAEALSGSIEARYGSAAAGRSIAAYATVRAGELALRLTGAQRSAEDYKIRDQARSADYERTFNPEINNPDLGISEPIPNPSGSVPNTHIDTNTGSIGLLWEPESGKGRLGVAYSRYDSSYGVPYQYGGDANELFGLSSLAMRQSRFDLDTAIETGLERFQRVRFRLGQADYSHEESFTGMAKDADKVYEDTRIVLDSVESRVDGYHRLFEGLEGVAGVHGYTRDLEASRLSAPPNESSRVSNEYTTENIGAFLVETWTLHQWTLRSGFRYERQSIEDLSFKAYGIKKTTEEDCRSMALGVTWRDYDRWQLDEVALTVNFSKVDRLPSETERYAFWSNAAIHRFIIGADNTGTPLEVERSDSLELGIEAHRGNWSGRLNLYYYEFENYIFLQDVKGIGNLAQYVAKEARFTGGEAELTWRAYDDEVSTLRCKGMIDRVRGKNLTDNTHLPRIPPMRIGSRIEYERGNLELGADLRYALSQKRVQAESDVVLPELSTEAYFELNFDAQHTWRLADAELVTFVRIENILDAERRTHVSFLKDVAPLPGRNLSVGMRWVF